MTAAIPFHENPISILSQWQPATWVDYERYRDDPEMPERLRLFFHNGYLKVDAMGWEGIKHAQVRDLFVMLLAFWFGQHPELVAESMGGYLMEKPELQGAAPDLMLYVGDGAPSWSKGEPRRIDLQKWRVPDLVGEVSDTTLASDLDEMKQLYAALGIPEYWVVNVPGQQVLAFRLVDGKYQECDTSVALPGLPIALLEAVLDRLAEGTNITAANWFMREIAKL
ncbi:MAG: Uma2 family endonuclease [Alkalinema sp. RU_4_3]|nr:Uma2 family endonuclease [Alkalinema sp. RU_4_3]